MNASVPLKRINFQAALRPLPGWPNTPVRRLAVFLKSAKRAWGFAARLVRQVQEEESRQRFFWFWLKLWTIEGRLGQRASSGSVPWTCSLAWRRWVIWWSGTWDVCAGLRAWSTGGRDLGAGWPQARHRVILAAGLHGGRFWAWSRESARLNAEATLGQLVREASPADVPLLVYRAYREDWKFTFYAKDTLRFLEVANRLSEEGQRRAVPAESQINKTTERNKACP